jgi:tyrosyl-tRNA synthetase
MPILEGTSGDGQKMSKSLGNYIGINEAPTDMFGKTMSIPDELILPYFELATNASPEELAEMRCVLEREETNPMELKKSLAGRLVEMYHGSEAARSAEEEFTRVFSGGGLPSDIPEPGILIDSPEKNRVWLVKIISASGLTKSNSEARRLIRQGAVEIDGRRVEDENLEVDVGSEFLLKVGKRRIARIKPENVRFDGDDH